MAVKIVIIGAGGLARDVVDIFFALNQQTPGAYDVLGYVVDKDFGTPGTLVYEKPILGDFDWLAAHVSEFEIICAAGTSEIRRQFVERATALGAKFHRAVHPLAVLSPSTRLGEGIIIKAGCLTASQVSLGAHSVLNLGSTVGHDTTLEDFVTVAAGVNLAGYIRVGEGTQLSIGSKVIERIEIGAWAFIGAGSVVTKNIPPFATATGMPARVIRVDETMRLKENFNDSAAC